MVVPFSQQAMQIFNVSIPDKPLINIELSTYARKPKIPHFRGVFMRDTLPLHPFSVECGIVNFNTYATVLICYYSNKTDGIYFDSYGQITPAEIQRYLETGSEFDRGKEVIQRKYRHCTSCEYISVWSLLLIRVEITSERQSISINSKPHAALWISTR